MARTEQELMAQGLPKWPQHYVTGAPVTVEQAKEIIRRTDTFFAGGYGGNNHSYNGWVRKTLGMAPGLWDRPHRPFPKDDATDAEKEADRVARNAELTEDRRLFDLFEKRWHPLSTSYVHNSWVSCSFIGGPYGWCHPDGQIGYVDNVGKWPSIESVFEDWKILAEAFPFLDIGVTLYDGESSEQGTRPVVSMVVKAGKVELADPLAVNVHEKHAKAQRRSDSAHDSVTEFITSYGNPRREQGLPDEWIEEWAAKFGAKAAG